jgi:uncharacterized protein YbjT (DUF2867 family)
MGGKVMVAKSNNSASETPVRKAYQKPTLAKAATLSAVTSQTPTSSSSDSNNTCWVARAAFGEADIRWMIFRAWLLDDAPAWFRRLYIRYGESVGAWLAPRENARGIVRTLMMPAVKRKLRG